MTGKAFTIALAGNPNVGKTSLFNAITGTRQHVGNWPGVTVEKKKGEKVHRGVTLKVVDLPGTYSLSTYSLDEIVARNFIVEERPNVVVHIVDASNLERNLYLSTQLMELGCPMVMALNMVDVVEKRGDKIDIDKLAEFLEIPVVKTIASIGYGVQTLLDEILREAQKGAHHEHVVGYGEETEALIVELGEILAKDVKLSARYPPRWLAVKLLEKDANILEKLELGPLKERVLHFLEGQDLMALEAGMADKRYEVINVILSQVLKRGEEGISGTDMLDHVLTHKYLGIPLFLILMWAAFQLTFMVAAPFMEMIDIVISGMIGWVHDNVGPPWLASLLGDGILGGVGFVIVFVPNIFILFFILALLEDSGYLSRAAFIMDKLMYRVGLHGKSFIPMLMGFGCNVPAIMATRTIEDEKDRLITILVNPFMSCGARLPVYLLLAGAFFGSQAGTMVFVVYLTGILLAVVSAKIFRHTVLKGTPAPFLMELPPYKMPTLKNTMLGTWDKGSGYLKKAGTFILGASIIVWVLTAFNAGGYLEESEKEIGTGDILVGEGVFQGQGIFVVAEDEDALFTGTVLETTTLRSGEYQKEGSYENISMVSGEELHGKGSFEGKGSFTSDNEESFYTGNDFVAEESFAADIGRSFEPLSEPLGFSWKMNTALVFGFVAKEMVVGSIGVLYGVGDDSASLTETLEDNPDFSPLVAFALMVFVLSYTPCVATVAVIYKETRSLKWTGFSVGYGLVVAWFMAFSVYQVGGLLGY